MEHLERPSGELWEERRLWFEETQAAAAAQGAGRLSEQGSALMIELQAVFCAGAWAATVLIAAAVVDAQSFHSGFPADGTERERAWLRNLRNALLHEDRRRPAFTVEDHWTRRGHWEREARRAVLLALRVLYPSKAVIGSGTRKA